MKTKIKIMPIFGTRPEAIKMAPVIAELNKTPEFETVVVVTAQHREMLDQVLELFRISPAHDLNIMSSGQTLSQITARVLEGMDSILENVRPDMVLVHGDTTTTFAAALAAYYRKIPTGHVEAGLRTFNKYSPYPEEMNRKLAGILSDLHFAPTQAAKENLIREGVPLERIIVTGNTVIDALLGVIGLKYDFSGTELTAVDFEHKRVVLITSHRRENIGSPMIEIFTAVKNIVTANQDVEVVFPVHKNPIVRGIANDILKGLDRVHLVEPLDYLPFANLMGRCYMIMTDSGGIQEEAPSLGKPVLVLRETTERPEALNAGTAKLAGTDAISITAHAQRLLDDKLEYARMVNAANPYGDGKAASRIVKALADYFAAMPGGSIN
jgi:UDP-N-acetylglucosamine 2-epimerase (non-hydrolysing)